jgi:hypothetical protein
LLLGLRRRDTSDRDAGESRSGSAHGPRLAGSGFFGLGG